MRVQVRWRDVDPAGLALHPRFFEWYDLGCASLRASGFEVRARVALPVQRGARRRAVESPEEAGRRPGGEEGAHHG